MFQKLLGKLKSWEKLDQSTGLNIRYELNALEVKLFKRFPSFVIWVPQVWCDAFLLSFYVEAVLILIIMYKKRHKIHPAIKYLWGQTCFSLSHLDQPGFN